MLFRDLLPTEADRQSLEKVCDAYCTYVQDCIGLLIQAFDLTVAAANKTQEMHHLSVIMLARHVIESLDSVSVLVAKGCSQPSQPLLRSALEALLGVFYILESDTKQRALAYEVVHAHKKIKLYERVDPTTKAGQELRRIVGSDPFGDVLSRLPSMDYPAKIANLQRILAKPDHQPIEAEWQRLKAARKGKDPEWYSFFSGPNSVRDLAIAVGHPGMYEFLYRYWSNEVHAGSALEAAGKKNGCTVIRPIRHPEEAQTAVIFAGQFSRLLSDKLIAFYAPEKASDMQRLYKEKLWQRALELNQKKVVIAPWRDSAPA